MYIFKKKFFGWSFIEYVRKFGFWDKVICKDCYWSSNVLVIVLKWIVKIYYNMYYFIDYSFVKSIK